MFGHEFTLPETNMTAPPPENRFFEDDPASLLGRLGLFSGAFAAVSFREGRKNLRR